MAQVIEQFIDGMASVMEGQIVDYTPDESWMQDGIEIIGDPFDAGVKFGKELGPKRTFARFTGRGKTTEKHGIHVRQWPSNRALIDVLVRKP